MVLDKGLLGADRSIGSCPGRKVCIDRAALVGGVPEVAPAVVRGKSVSAPLLLAAGRAALQLCTAA